MRVSEVFIAIVIIDYCNDCYYKCHYHYLYRYYHYYHYVYEAVAQKGVRSQNIRFP